MVVELALSQPNEAILASGVIMAQKLSRLSHCFAPALHLSTSSALVFPTRFTQAYYKRTQCSQQSSHLLAEYTFWSISVCHPLPLLNCLPRLPRLPRSTPRCPAHLPQILPYTITTHYQPRIRGYLTIKRLPDAKCYLTHQKSHRKLILMADYTPRR